MHVELDESRLVQLLPQDHLHPHVVVDVEDEPVEEFVVVVVGVFTVVWSYEAVRAHLVTGVQRSQKHHSSCGRTVRGLKFALHDSGVQESVSGVSDEIGVIHLQLFC